MKILSSPHEVQNWRREIPAQATLGFVPTMGALHAGHAKLLERARRENEFAALSIFVNPTQFNDPKDLEKYPRTLEKDLEWARREGLDLVWTPNFEMMYPDQYRYKISENDFSQVLCGAHRPGHFDGVLTVVMKLLNALNPTHAYFGEKDFQQLTLIQKMAEAFFLPMKIVPVPTVREVDGLAMSSRNTRLTPSERTLAPEIYRVLTHLQNDQEARSTLEAKGFRVEYLERWQGRRLIAAWLGQVRLIDNVPEVP